MFQSNIYGVCGELSQIFLESVCVFSPRPSVHSHTHQVDQGPKTFIFTSNFIFYYKPSAKTRTIYIFTSFTSVPKIVQKLKMDVGLHPQRYRGGPAANTWVHLHLRHIGSAFITSQDQKQKMDIHRTSQIWRSRRIRFPLV